MKVCELKVVFTAMHVSYLGVKNNKKIKRKKKVPWVLQKGSSWLLGETAVAMVWLL